jgi:hypothetical protein
MSSRRDLTLWNFRVNPKLLRKVLGRIGIVVTYSFAPEIIK